MSARLIRCDDIAAGRWRNGGGVTRELLAWPTADDWRVRISVADVAADGPFSSFPGVTRWFAVVQGAGVELVVDGSPRRCTPRDPPERFAGAATTTCRLLDGPTRDLNLMLRATGGTMHAVVPDLAWQPGAAVRAAGVAQGPQARQAGVFAVVAGRCTFDDATIEVSANSLLWLDPAPGAMTFTPRTRSSAAVGWWIAVADASGAAA